MAIEMKKIYSVSVLTDNADGSGRISTETAY